MRQSVLDLGAFYREPLGRAARRMILRKIGEAWGSMRGLDVLGLGYAAPFLEGLGDGAGRCLAAAPAGQGVEAWPNLQPRRACLTEEAQLPFPNAVFDRILAVHALEEADDALAVLHELHRVLAPSGRLMVVVASRSGLWANAETTPLGHGRPFSRRQLEVLMQEAELSPTGWTRALYAPPAPWAAAWADGFEQVGARLWRPFAGVILMEAVKETFAVRPLGRAVVARNPRRGLLVPVAGATTIKRAAQTKTLKHPPPWA